MDHCGEWDLSSVQPRRRSSEPQVVTAQLVDGPAAHQLHVAFDFGSEIFKRPFNAGLTPCRQSIQIKSPSRTRLRAHGKGLQDVGATGDAAVANHIYSVADSIDDLGELIERAPRQGNRVNKSCCDKTCEEVVVPSGDFSFEAQAVLSGGPSDQVVGHVFYGGEVGGSVIGADAAFVVAEDHVHDPV